MTFRSEHSLEVTVHIVFKHFFVKLAQTHKESYICEFRSGMLGTQKYNAIVDFSMLFVYVNTEWYITLYMGMFFIAARLHQCTMLERENIKYICFILASCTGAAVQRKRTSSMIAWREWASSLQSTKDICFKYWNNLYIYMYIYIYMQCLFPW